MKPTILFVTDIPCWGGSTLSLRDLLTSIRDKINPIVIVYKKDTVYDYMINNNIKCYVVSYSLSTFVNSHTCLLYPHFIYSSIKNYFLFRKGVKEIKTLFGDEKIDIVHSNTSAVDFGYKIAKTIGAKHIWHVREMLESFHNTYYVGGYSRLKIKMRHSDLLIFISNACAVYWGMNLLSNCKVVGDAVRSKSEKINIKEKKKYFLFCSYELSDFKGADIAIKAFGESGLSNIGYRLKMIGWIAPDYKVKLDSLSSQFGISDKIDYLGVVDSIQVKDYMSEATAFLQCGEMEGLGRTAIEAMFYGCPVIARNCGGTLDFINHQVTGFLWNSVEECSDDIRYVATHDVNHIIINAQSFVTNKYSIENYGKEMIDIYNYLK